MNQTTGDSRKQKINGAAVLKENEKKPIQVIEQTDFETGTLVKLAENPETSVEIKTGNVKMVRLNKESDGIDAIYIPDRDEIFLVNQGKVTPEQHAAIKAKYKAYMEKIQKEEPQI